MNQPVALNLAAANPSQRPEERTPAASAATHPSNPRTPLFIPKQPPPKALKRWDPAQTPEPGTWVRVTTKRETYTGRLIFLEEGRMRLKEGAGFWDITTQDILSLEQPPDPRGKRGKNASREPVEVTLTED
jgi:hypothetical protein